MKKGLKYKHVVISETTKDTLDSMKGELSYNAYLTKVLSEVNINQKLDLILQNILHMKEVKK